MPLVLSLGLLFVAASGAAGPTVTPTPSPAPRAIELSDADQEPTSEPATLQDYARRLRQTPEALRPTPHEKPLDARVRFRSVRDNLEGQTLVVRGEIESLMGREIWVALRVSAEALGNRMVSADITPSGGRILVAYQVVYFEARLPGGIPGTARLEVVSFNELGGTISRAQEKAKRAEMRKCMSFKVLLPNSVEKGSESVEVRLKNNCSSRVLAERTSFRLVLKDGMGLVKDQRVDRFHQDAEPGQEIRRSLILPVAPHVRPEVVPYDELLDR